MRGSAPLEIHSDFSCLMAVCVGCQCFVKEKLKSGRGLKFFFGDLKNHTTFAVY